MVTPKVAEAAGHARWTFRLRNECVTKSKAVHLRNNAAGGKRTCGPAQLDKMLTEARRTAPWLAEGSSVPQQQIIRDFGRSRAKAQKDIKERVPVHRRAGMPKRKRKREALPSLNCTKRGFRLKGGRLYLAGGIVLTVVWSRELPDGASSVRIHQDSLGHWYASFVVPAEVQPLSVTGRVIGVDRGVKETATTTSDAHDLPHVEHGRKAREKLARYDRNTVHLVRPAHTTMDCAHCGARAKHALPLGERTYTCTTCGTVSPRDKNSARVMLVRAGLNPAGAEGIGPPGAPPQEAA